MGRSKLGSRYNFPSHAIPALGKLSENRSEVFVSKESWYVFQEDEAGSHFAYDSDCFRPEIPVVGLSDMLSSDAPRLAREAARDDVNEATPRSPVEGLDVVPDREQGEQTVPLPPQEDFPAERLDFHGANGSPSKEGGSEQPPSNACK